VKVFSENKFNIRTDKMRTLKIEKKHIPAIILVVACIVTAILCGIKAVREIKYKELLPESDIISLEGTYIIADGGNGTTIPKNTSYAIDDLLTKQFTAIRIDARLTKDKKYVALADSDISTLTKGKGEVGSYNYFDLLEFNIRNFKPRENPVIELVSEVGKYAHSNGISPIIYLHDFNKKAVKELMGNFSEEGVSVYAYASDNLKELRYIRKQNIDTGLIYQVDEVTDEAIEACKTDGNMSICFNGKDTKQISTCIEKMESEQISYLCYGVETLNDIEELYKLGVRRFITDTVKAG